MSKEAKERVVGYIDIGEREGANLVLDGRKVEGDADPEGFFVGPTIFDGVTPDMKIASDEIFGPVVGVIRANDLEGALEVIRSSGFGNAATIYTESGKSAESSRYRAPVGNVGINVGVAAPMAYFPFGGQGSSFFGSHHGQGRDGVDFFTDRKVVITVGCEPRVQRALALHLDSPWCEERLLRVFITGATGYIGFNVALLFAVRVTRSGASSAAVRRPAPSRRMRFGRSW